MSGKGKGSNSTGKRSSYEKGFQERKGRIKPEERHVGKKPKSQFFRKV